MNQPLEAKLLDAQQEETLCQKRIDELHAEIANVHFKRTRANERARVYAEMIQEQDGSPGVLPDTRDRGDNA